MTITFRERYLGVCHFERPGDLLLSGPNLIWVEALREWVKQGAPEEIMNFFFCQQYFQFDPLPRWLVEIRSGLEWWRGKVYDLGHGIRAGDWGTAPAYPGFVPKILEEDERTVVMIDGGGRKVKSFKQSEKMPMFLEYPVKDRASWKEYKKRLDPATPGRYPDDWDAYVRQINEQAKELPISLQVGGFFGYLREWMGLEPLLYMFYDDPALVEEMMDGMLYLEMEVVKRVVKDIKIDQATYWEDMCYKSGPMISPAMFRKFMMPRYKKLNDLLNSHGVDIIWVDSDGNLEQLIPLWLEVGVNYVWPLEVAAGNDAVALRKKYGKDLIMGGAIDKRVLARGKEAIREEVMSKVPFLVESGGYIPSVDHWVPPDVSFENYCFYVNTLREIAGLEKLSF